MKRWLVLAFAGWAAPISLDACSRPGVPPGVVAAPVVAQPPPANLPAAAARPAPSTRPVEVANLKTPSWLSLEEVYGAYDNLHHLGLVDLAFAPDGRALVTLGLDGQLRVWDLVTRTLRAQPEACAVRSPPDPFWPRALKLALSADGLAAVGFGGGRVCVMELDGDRLVRNIDAHKAHIMGLRFGGGALVSFAYQDTEVDETSIGPMVRQRRAGGEARWWDPRTGAQLGEVEAGRAEDAAVSPDGAWLATGRTRWDMEAGKPGHAVALWQRGGPLRWRIAEAGSHVAVTGAGDVLFTGWDGGLRMRSAETYAAVPRFEATAAEPRASGENGERYAALAASDDGRFAATPVEGWGTLVLWDVRARREIGRQIVAGAHAPGGGTQQRVVFSPDGSLIATAGQADAAVWGARGLVQLLPRGHTVLGDSALLPDGRHVLSSRDGIARLVELATGQTRWRWEMRGGARAELLPDGTRFLESYYDTTKMRDVQTGRVLWGIQHQPKPDSVVVSPDGTRLTSIDNSRGGTRLHDAADGRVLWRRAETEPLAFSSDGRTLWVRAFDWHVLGLAVADGAVQTRIDREREDTTSLWPSPDGRRAVVVGYRDTSGYDLVSGKRLWRADSADHRIAIRPDNATFVSDTTTVRLRSLATGLDVAPPFEVHKQLPGTSFHTRVLPDGRTMLLDSNEGLVYRFRLGR